MPVAQAETPPDAQPQPVPPQRDRREELMPGDPLGIRPGGESIVIAGTGGENARIARIARSGAEPGPSIDERNRAYRYELMTVVLVLAFFGLAVLWLYRRRGRANFAGLGDDRN